MRGIIITALAIALWAWQEAFAEQTLFYKEINLIGGYSDQDKWVGKSSELLNSVGFEYYRKFSNDYGDFLTTDLQMRLTYNSKRSAEDAWGLEIHNAWLQYKLNSVNKVKVGHFRPPFGLEQVLDTHGTILQTLTPRNIGFKKYWGLALEGTLPGFDYSAALQLGSGMSIYRRDGSFLSSFRIGTPSDRNAQGGISFLYGKTLETEGMSTYPRADLLSDNVVLKKRVGLDGQFNFGPYLMKSEVAFGQDGHENVLGYLAELDYTLPKLQNLEFQLQYQSWQHHLGEKGMDDSTLTTGLSYKLSQSVTLRTAYMHDFNLMGEREDDQVLLQIYYFGW